MLDLADTQDPMADEAEAVATPVMLRAAVRRGIVLAALITFAVFLPNLLNPVWQSIALSAMIAGIGAIGLNVLVGLAGQLSIAQGALLAVGAYTSVHLTMRLDVPFIISAAAGGVFAALAGTIMGLPSLRIRGLYLVMATLAGQLVLEWIIVHWTGVTGGPNGINRVPPPSLFGHSFSTVRSQYLFALGVVVVVGAMVSLVTRTTPGRSWALTRDAEHIAQAYGQSTGKNKLLAFTFSSFVVGFAGALYAHTSGAVNPDFFGLNISINYLIMIVLGGLGSVGGALIGAGLMTALPEILSTFTREFDGTLRNFRPYLTQILSGLAVIVVLIVEPGGIVALATRVRRRLGSLGTKLRRPGSPSN